MPNVGPLEIVVVLALVLIIFGPKRLPELGRSLGRGIREFRGSLSGENDDDDKPQGKLGVADATGTPPGTVAPADTAADAEKKQETTSGA